MCDTMVVPRGAAGNSATLFAKNSDREPNEAQQVVIVPAADYAADESLTCTYIAIPHARHTHRVLLSKPCWLWGAEMGANEHGVAIGNEALFTINSRPADPPAENGLIGMDLLRLGLERATSAVEALEVITALLERWGQGGNCGFTRDFRYDNSFLIADPREAWLLETSGREWVAKRVASARSISNAPTLEDDWDRASAALEEENTKVNFAATYTDSERTLHASGVTRCARTQSLLNGAGEITPVALVGYLRDHGTDGGDADWSPATAEERSICMHASHHANAGSQTTGSMVSVLGAEQQLHFVSAVAAPCTAIFLPFWIDCDAPRLRLTPTRQWDDATLFWRHEGLHRAILADYQGRMALWRPLRDEVEAEIVAHALELQNAPKSVRERFTAACVERVHALYGEWAVRFNAREDQAESAYLRFWRELTLDAL